MIRALLVALALVLAFSPTVDAGPKKRASKSVTTKSASQRKATKKPHTARTRSRSTKPTRNNKSAKSAARVAYSFAGELRPTSEVVGRREEPLTLEEEIAKQIEKLLRGPLRRGITGLYVADARTGEPLFAVNSDDALNPASNVKLISTAAALELLGPTFRYSTRVLGRGPDKAGVIQGDLYLLGTWDPTLTLDDMNDLAQQIAARGVTQIDGDILVGSDPTRDGIYRAVIPIEITAGEPGHPPTAKVPAGFDLIELEITAKTEKRPRKRHRLKFKQELVTNASGHKRIKLTISGTIGKGRDTIYRMSTRERTAVASHALRAALRAHAVTINGDVRVAELGDFIGIAVGTAGLPVELARHDSDQLQDIVRRINKWSVNWLADRVIMTAAALARRTKPTMQVAIDAMYEWLQRHPDIDKSALVIDTGSGLSYRTRMTPEHIVKIVRAATGYMPSVDATCTHALSDSLAIAGTDGTLRSRFRMASTREVRGHLRGKTGTLSTVIALSGLLELDPSRPLAFSIVTNTDRPLRKGYVRKAHEQLVRLLADYVTATAKPTTLPHGTPIKIGKPTPAPLPELDDKPDTISDEIAEPQLDPELDAEAAGKATAAP